MKKALVLGFNKAYNGLKEWTDPSFEGNPYGTYFSKEEPFELKKLFFFGKKMLWRS